MSVDEGVVTIRTSDEKINEYLDSLGTDVDIERFRKSLDLLGISGDHEEVLSKLEKNDWPFIGADWREAGCFRMEVGGDGWVELLRILGTSRKIDVWANLWSDYEDYYFASVSGKVLEKHMDREEQESSNYVDPEWEALLPDFEE